VCSDALEAALDSGRASVLKSLSPMPTTRIELSNHLRLSPAAVSVLRLCGLWNPSRRRVDRVEWSWQCVYMHISDAVAKNLDASRLREVARACACANLRRAARAVTQVFDEALGPSGLRATQFTLLVTSRLMGESTINELAERMAMDRTTLSRNLKPLVRSGLLEVRPGEDGRTRLVRLTPAGEHALEEAYPLWQQAQQETVGILGEERHEALLGDVSRMVSLAARGPREARSGTA
jgi:DNA-binding MarR family transcriptional regulator